MKYVWLESPGSMLATRRSLLKRLGGRLRTHWPRVDAKGGGVVALGLRERRLGEEGDCLRVLKPGVLSQRDRYSTSAG